MRLLRCLFGRASAFGAAATALFAALPAPAAGAQGTGLGTPTLALDSLLNSRVSAASKYAQRAADAPASVTIITADDIRQYGYRDLREALEVVRGFYVSDDRNYVSIGTRGFGRPGDYNNRILLLVDGHTLNDQTWGGAPIGSELPIPMEAVERIEVVRGPGSALYGTSAMFAVINVVTKTGAEMDGVSISPRVGNAGIRELGATAGRPLGLRRSIVASGLIARSDGPDLYFPELDSPATNNGVARGMDWERAVGGIGSLVWDDLTARVGHRSREKGVPTGAFETSLADPRAQTIDETLWGELALQHEFAGSRRLTIRAFANRYRYRGAYPSDPGGPLYSDGGGSSHIGGEAFYIWDPSSRMRITFGAEHRNVMRADYYENQADGSTSADNSPFNLSAAFAQSEWQIRPKANLVAGLRYEQQRGADAAVTPRIALILNPDARTTAKFLLGEAFRAPTAAEAHLNTSYYMRNPSLKPERIRTLELELQRRMNNALLLGGSVYSYRIRNLIEQGSESAEGVRFENLSAARARGVELQADLLSRSTLSARATYAWQRTQDEFTRDWLTNSPVQVATVTASAALRAALRTSVTLRHESPRQTLTGTSTPTFTRVDANIRYALRRSVRAPMREVVLSLRVTNLFDATWATPGGLEHRQSSIPQDGRCLIGRLDWRF